MTMKRLLALIFAVACASANAQTGITVMADTNRVIRTNFFISNSQVQGLTNLLNAKQTATAALTNLSTNNGGSLTNLTASSIVGAVATASNVSGIVAIANGGTGSSSASNARVALGLGTAATNPSSAFQPASTNLDALALNNGAALTNLSATNFLPAYSNNAGKVLSVATGSTNIEWIAISNTVTDGSTITNLPLSNTVGTLSVVRGGTGATNVSDARINLLPAYSNNASKVLALNTNATDVEWITITNTGGGTSGVTSVDVSGGSTGLTTSGGPITNSGTITLGGTLSIAAGGTGQTNAALAIEALLPAYTNNANKILALNSNATSLVWTTNAGGGGGGSGTVTSIDASGGSTGMNFTGGPITNSGTLTLGGTLAIGSGGTGASDVTNARIALLPSYTNNAGKALVLNTNATDITWQTIPSVPVSIANGGTGGTNRDTALAGLSITTNGGSTVRIGSADTYTLAAATKAVVIGDLATAEATHSVAIGNGATVFTNAQYGIAIGNGAYASDLGDGYGGAAVAPNGGVEGLGGALGYSADVYGDGAAVGHNSYAEDGAAVGRSAYAENGFAGGLSAYASASNSVQLLQGTNTNNLTIQFLSAGSVTTNAWSALANSTTFGHYIMAAPTNGTNGQVLAVNSNATAVIWTNVSGVQADLSNVTGTLAVANGGTGGTTASNARVNLLPSYTGNQNLVLALNSNATDVVWSAAGSGVIDLSTTNATGILPVSKGGSGASTTNGALTNFGIITASAVTIPALTNSVSSSVVIGRSATMSGGGNVMVGDSTSGGGGTGLGGVAIGRSASVTNSGIGIGYQASGNTGIAIGYQSAVSSFGVAIGYQATNTSGAAAIGQTAVSTAAGGFQLGTGSNGVSNTIQFRAGGTVNETEWGYLANASTKGGSRMTNTNGVTVTNTIIGYDGTNYTTNTITVIDGIITSWTQ